MMKPSPLALALTCALSLALLSACGGGNTGSASSSAGQTSASAAVSTPAEPDQTQPDQTQPDQSAPDASQPQEGAASEEEQPAQGDGVLTLNRSDFTLKAAGASFRLRYTCQPDPDAIPEFSSSNEAVATVSADGTVTAVAPGTAAITLNYGGLTARCTVRCTWEEDKVTAPSTDGSSSAGASGGSAAQTPAQTPAQVDLSAFYASLSGKYEFPSSMALADQEVQDAFYPGLSGVATQQCLVYANLMSMNMGEFVLVQVKDSKDVDTVKAILQSRIDAMVDGGAWYPESTEQWANNAKVVSNGNYIMMVVHESNAAIVKEFNALF